MKAFDISFTVGFLSMLLALFLVTTTFATHDYSVILRTAAISAAISFLAFIRSVMVATKWQRVVVFLAALPLLFVLSEIVRRI